VLTARLSLQRFADMRSHEAPSAESRAPVEIISRPWRVPISERDHELAPITDRR
jgi:hypothetical protein